MKKPESIVKELDGKRHWNEVFGDEDGMVADYKQRIRARNPKRKGKIEDRKRRRKSRPTRREGYEV